MVGVAQLVRAPDCGSGCRGFESLYPPHVKGREGRSCGSGLFPSLKRLEIQGCSQAVRQGTLTPSFAGSSPAIPATSSRQSPLRSEHPAGHSSLCFLASPLQIGPASLGSDLVGTEDANSVSLASPLLLSQCSPLALGPHWVPAPPGTQVNHDPLAQSAEHLPFKQGVRSSNLRRVTKRRRYEPSLSSGMYLLLKGALQNEKFCSASFLSIQGDVGGGHVENPAQNLLFWYSKAGPGENTGAKCGNYSVFLTYAVIFSDTRVLSRPCSRFIHSFFRSKAIAKMESCSS